MERFRTTSPFCRWPLRYACLLAAALFGHAYTLVGQRFDFDFFTVNEGLSDRQITSLHLGAEGFVWVGTRDGLNRFDGYRFLQLGQGPYSSTGLSLGNIAKIGSDIEGKFSIFYQDVHTYFDRFDPTSFAVEQVQLAPSNGIIGFPRAFATDELGRIFAVTLSRQGTRLYEYTPKGFTLLHFLEEDRNNIAAAVALCPLRNGQFLLYDTDQGLRHLNAAGALLHTLALDQTDAAALYSSGRYERVNFLEEVPGGQVLFSFFGHSGLYSWPIGTEAAPKPLAGLPSTAYYQQLFKDQRGQALLGLRYSPGAVEQSEAFYLIDTAATFLAYDDLREAGSRIYAAVAENFKEKIFLGRYEGLGVAESPKKKLWSFLAIDQQEEYKQNLVSGICEDRDGAIYCLEAAGQLYRIHPATNTYDTLPLYVQDGLGEVLALAATGPLVYDAQRHAIWGIGQKDGQRKQGILFSYQINHCHTAVYLLPEHRFTALAMGWNGQLLLGAEQSGGQSGKLLFFDTMEQAFTPLLLPQLNDFLQTSVPQYLLLRRQAEQLVVGTRDKGLLVYDYQQQAVKTYTPPLPGKRALVFNDYNISVLHEAEDGAIWVGTRGGLHRLDLATESLRFYGRPDGLSSNLIQGMVDDGEGGFWLSTANGLTHLKQEGTEITFRRYYRSDGLSSDAFNRFAFLHAKDGRFYFGGVNGLSAFYPRELADLATDAKVVITQITLYGRGRERLLNQGLEELDEVVVEPSEKGIAIQFALPATTRADRNRFRVKLEGLQTEWVALNNEHTARFNNLNAGRYTLHIQGADANGNYAAHIVSLPIRVRQYIYERTWFLVGMGLLIAGLVIGFLQSRARERLRSEQLRTQLSSDIHDEVSGLLAGITLQTELLQSYTTDEHLRNRLVGIGEAGRKAMSKMSDVIWSIDSRRDTVSDLLQRMQEHADDVLLPLDIRYQFHVEGLQQERQQGLAGSKRQDIYFIYKEAINNIARHSNATQVSITMSQRNNEFEMLIYDNGMPDYGFDIRRSVKTGQGLANLQMRAQRLGAQLLVDTHQGYSIRLKMRRI